MYDSNISTATYKYFFIPLIAKLSLKAEPRRWFFFIFWIGMSTYLIGLVACHCPTLKNVYYDNFIFKYPLSKYPAEKHYTDCQAN